MTSANRKPIYTTDGRYRIISVSGGAWRLQKVEPIDGTRTIDPWWHVGPATDVGSAQAALRAHDVAPKKAA